jgi:hypothetical protein
MPKLESELHKTPDQCNEGVLLDAILRMAFDLEKSALVAWNLNPKEVAGWQQDLLAGRVPTNYLDDTSFESLRDFEEFVIGRCRFSYNRKLRLEKKKGTVIYWGGRYLYKEEVEHINKQTSYNQG